MKAARSELRQILPQISLFEFDQRFGMFEEFELYDFVKPTELPSKTSGISALVLLDADTVS